MQIAREIAFGGFRLDLGNECLWQDGRAISLRPKAFAVLRLLLQHPGLLVTKQRVLDTVWPGTFVGDGVLKDNIRQLREALDDDAASPTYIETAHRRGYRFIGKLHAATPNKIPQPAAFSQLPPTITALTASATANAILGRNTQFAKMRTWLEPSSTAIPLYSLIASVPGTESHHRSRTRTPLMRDGLSPVLSYSGQAMRYAFVVRLEIETKPSEDRFEGWVEEVNTGNEMEFRSREELLKFLGERFHAALQMEPERAKDRMFPPESCENS